MFDSAYFICLIGVIYSLWWIHRFRVEGEQKYTLGINDLGRPERNTLTVNFEDVEKFNQNLSTTILEEYYRYVNPLNCILSVVAILLFMMITFVYFIFSGYIHIYAELWKTLLRTMHRPHRGKSTMLVLRMFLTDWSKSCLLNPHGIVKCY